MSKEWLNLDHKPALYRNGRIFLLQCRTESITANHIRNNMECLFILNTDDHPFQNKITEILYIFSEFRD